MSARDALLDAAFFALLETGPAFPTDEVVRRAGLSKGLLFHHFGSREGLLDAMAARVLAQTQEGLDHLDAEHPNPRERLLALARTLLEPPVDAPPAQARRVMLFWLQDDGRGGCRASLRDALLLDFVATLVAEGVATGAMRPGTDAARIAHRLLQAWHGATAVHAAGGAFDFEAEADRLAAELARRVAPG